MARRGIPLLPQELIGFHLGLTVPTARKNEFWNPRHAEEPAVASGFGTQIQNEKDFGMQKALRELKIPLTFVYVPPSKIKDASDFSKKLQEIIETDQDVLLCLNWGTLTDQPQKNWGHIMAVDRLTNDDVRLIDTDIGAKWKTFSLVKTFAAVHLHGDENYGGLWIFKTPE